MSSPPSRQALRWPCSCHGPSCAGATSSWTSSPPGYRIAINGVLDRFGALVLAAVMLLLAWRTAGRRRQLLQLRNHHHDARISRVDRLRGHGAPPVSDRAHCLVPGLHRQFCRSKTNEFPVHGRRHLWRHAVVDGPAGADRDFHVFRRCVWLHHPGRLAAVFQQPQWHGLRSLRELRPVGDPAVHPDGQLRHAGGHLQGAV